MIRREEKNPIEGKTMATAGTIRVTLTNKDPAKTADKGKRMPREVTCLGCGERLLEVDAVRIVGHNGYAIHCGTIR